MRILLCALAGFLLDLLLGDPAWLPPPVVFMGKGISFLEKHFRPEFPQTARGEFRAGVCLALALTLDTLIASCLLLWLAGMVHPYLQWALMILWSWQVLAMKGLRTESRNVYHRLKHGTLEEARTAVSRIVGRDTQALTEEGVTKAAVETVAENFSDGVVAPLFYLLLGGPPLALCYKAINTMDSMIGYKNEKYLYFGRAAARLDDAANYLPSRLSALLLIAAAFLSGRNGKSAWRIWRRDRRNHASPNSAQTEAAMAGALEVELAGPASYFGEFYDKPTIGDPVRPITPEDIPRANRLMYLAGFLALLLLGGLRFLILYFVF